MFLEQENIKIIVNSISIEGGGSLIESFNSSSLLFVHLREIITPSNMFQVFTFLVAIFAVFLSWVSIRESKKANILSIKPLLLFRQQTSSKTGKVKFYIANKGLGPLTFEKFEFVYNGGIEKKVMPVFRRIRLQCNLEDSDFVENSRVYTYPLEGYSMHVQEEKTLLRFQLNNKSKEDFRAIKEELKKLDIHYSYIDLFNNKVEGTFKLTY